MKNCHDFCPVVCRAEILTMFGSHFGRNHDFINSLGNCLNFNALRIIFIHVIGIGIFLVKKMQHKNWVRSGSALTTPQARNVNGS